MEYAYNRNQAIKDIEHLEELKKVLENTQLLTFIGKEEKNKIKSLLGKTNSTIKLIQQTIKQRDIIAKIKEPIK